MKESDPISRRTVIKITGVAGVTAAIAGCSDGGPGNGNDTEEEEPAGEEPAEEEEPGMEDNETEGNETEGNETEDNETEDNETEEVGAGGEAIEPDTQIVLEAQTSAWMGVEPEQIADQENPTITLQQDESYEIGWEEGDGATHNIELVDENDEVVDDYQTEESNEGGEDQFIEFDATDEIAEYVCRPHEGTMRGTIELEEGGAGGMGGNETDNETANETANETDNETDNETANETDNETGE